MEQNVKKLMNPMRTNVLYLWAKFCFNMVACMEMYYISAYTTDKALIPVTLTFLPLTVPTVIDFIMSFLNGVILEKSKHPLGKYTFWLIIGPIVASICYILVYVRWESDVFCAVIMCVLIIIAHLFWNLAEICHTTIPSVFTDDVKERSTLSMLQNSGSTWSSFLFGLVALPIINYFNEKTGTLTKGYFTLTLFAGILYCIGYIMLGVSVRGMEKREADLVAASEAKRAAQTGTSGKLTGKEMLKSFFGNGPLVCLTFFQIFTWLTAFVPMGFQYYFFNCSIGQVALMGVFTSATSLCGMFSMFMFPIWTKVFKGNKKRFMCTLMIPGFVWSYCFYFIRPNIMIHLVVQCVFRVVTGCSGFNTLALYADTATYAQWKTGADSRAFVMSCYSIPLKLALLIRGILTSAILVAIKYDATLEPSTYSNTFWNVYVLMAAIFTTCGWLIFLIGYHLPEAKVTEMAKEIAARAAE